jgi:hypothetical protein
MVGTYDPELYDLATPESFRGDVDWYRGKAQESGGPILELGAGTGRITLPIALDGLAIHALDVHRGMLTVLRRKIAALPEDARKRITVTEGDMRAFQANVKFALIIIPFRAFLHRYEQYDGEGNLTRTFLHRLELAYLYPADIRRLLEQSGFKEVQIAGGFSGQAFANDTDELVVEAKRI